MIAKYEVDENEWEFNTALYPDVSEDKFAGDFLSGDESGNWTYTPGASDPGIRYWAAKGGDFFLLHWIVDDSAVDTGGVCDVADPYNLACLSEALVVESATYSAPQTFGLSHLTFYDTEPPNGPNGEEIPEPGSIALLGLGLLGLGYAARRRKRAA